MSVGRVEEVEPAAVASPFAGILDDKEALTFVGGINGVCQMTEERRLRGRGE